ncbi:MAG TPA: hypothetical protein PKE06_04975 [Flavilitoribacter sp.]|nr:hypothetical protein [Lewinella sp.]MCB9278595.1 hypothetical protein [Lewinellaceae bacterium]HMQ59998.1 hypothetical protein [Flavilitoribacter sp.]HMQ86156.1 hypothetical protein [Flavilitoribacter sp.]
MTPSNNKFAAAAECEYTIQFQILAEVEFGVVSKKCRNFGICRITPAKLDDLGSATTQDRKSTAIATVFCKNHVEMDFLKHSITSSTYDRYFSCKRFLVDEDFEYSLPQSKSVDFSIQKGEYDIQENNTLIKVIFK